MQVPLTPASMTLAVPGRHDPEFQGVHEQSPRHRGTLRRYWKPREHKPTTTTTKWRRFHHPSRAKSCQRWGGAASIGVVGQALALANLV